MVEYSEVKTEQLLLHSNHLEVLICISKVNNKITRDLSDVTLTNLGKIANKLV
jgi:hypothetical protein